jgi:hypothetical protein
MVMGTLADVRRGWTLPADCVPISFSRHSIEQANRRVFRRLDLDEVERQLSRELGTATCGPRMPEWVRHRTPEEGWLVFPDLHLAFPLDAAFRAKTAFSDFDGELVGASVRWVRGGASGSVS